MANYAKFKMQQMGVMPIVYEPRQGAEWFEEEVCKMFIEKGLRTEIPAQYFKTEFYHETFIERFTEVVDVDIFDELLTDADQQRVESILGTWEINRGKLELVEVTVSANGDDPTWIRDWTEEWLRRNEDELLTRIADLAFRMLIYEADEFNGPIFEVSLRPTDDWRWLELYAPDLCRIDKHTTIIYNGESTLKYMMEHSNTETTDHALWREEVIRRTANLPEGRVWRGYSDVNEALAFTLYAIDHQWDYDQLMERIGMSTDQHTAERSLFVDGLEVQPTADHERELKPIKANNSKTNNTTMAQTNNNTNAAKPWKAQAANDQMTYVEYTKLYYDRFFKEQLDAVKIDTEGHSLIDLLQVQGVTSAWSCNDEGSRVTFTITMGEGFVSAHTFDLKNNGSRTNETTIGGVTYKWISLAKMREAILKFDGDKAPADIQQYVTNKIGAVNTSNSSEAPQPQKAPTAKVRTAPIAEQTVPQTTEQHKATEQPSITPAPSTTDATYHFSGDDHYYHLYRDEDGVNGGVVIVRRDGGLNSHIKHRDFAQLSAFIASKKMTKMEQLPDALMKALVKEGVVKALKVVEKPKTEEKPQPKAIEQPKQQPKDTTKDYIKQHLVVSGGEQMTDKVVDKFVEQTAPQETPTKEIKGNQEQPKKVEPEAKVVPFTLPDTIVAGDLKDGRMTLTGLTDLTAEQVQIFIAGMNAMKEAIKKQMKMTGTDNADLSF